MSNAVVTDWPSGSANTGWPQEPSAMLMPGRVQGWPAGTQRAANPATTLLSQAVAWWDVESYREGDRFLRNRGTGGELLDLRLGSSIVANSNDPRFLEPEGSGYVYLPGVVFNSLTVPDEAALDITGDLDIRCRVALDEWTGTSAMIYVAKYSASEMSFQLAKLNATATGGGDRIALSWSPTGSTTTPLTAVSTVGTGLAAGEVKWIRATLDVDNGEPTPQYEVRFYLSDDAVTWTQLGTTITGSTGVTSIFASSAELRIGARQFNTTGPLSGKVYAAQIWDGIEGSGGTLVLDVDCDAITSGSATSFTAVTNQTVTVNRSTSGRKSVAVPSRHKGGKPVMLLGTDDYLECVDSWQHGLLNCDQGDSFTVLLVGRVTTANRPLIYKASTFQSGPGYNLGTLSGPTGRIWIGDGSATGQVNADTAFTVGAQLNLFAGVVAPDRVTSYVNSVGTTSRYAIIGGRKNQLPLRVGTQSGSPTTYADMELYAAAIFRRALTAAEITTLSNYFTGRIA